MKQPLIRLAKLSDTSAIMQFLHDHYRKNHFLSKNEQLFRYEFQDDDRLNFGIALDQEELLGVFGFIKYNYSAVPDIAGSLWQVIHSERYPMLGIKLRNFVIKNVPHLFFAAPGANLSTRPIYQSIGMNWNAMQHYYLLNPEKSQFELCDVADGIQAEQQRHLFSNLVDMNVRLSKIDSIDALADFPFSDYGAIRPFKDLEYIKKRFFDYPIYHYDVYVLHVGKELKNIVVCRQVNKQGQSAYRVVDFYGEETFMPQIISELVAVVIEQGNEYLDFISFGFDKQKMIQSGFSLLDYDNESVIVPHYFEPYVKQNIPVFCVSDRLSGGIFRQCMADGDQDRPNQY